MCTLYQFLQLMICSPDTSKVFVDVGLGFHVEFTLDEAAQFIDKKEKVLTRYLLLYFAHIPSRSDIYSNQAAQIKTRIKLVIAYILQNLF